MQRGVIQVSDKTLLLEVIQGPRFLLPMFLSPSQIWLFPVWSWISNISITWDLAKNVKVQAPPWPSELESMF